VIKNEIGRPCGTCGGKERRIEAFGGKIRRKEATWKT
jgi:hypothetical protein